MSQHPFQIRLIGGPLDGQGHELEGRLMPAAIGLHTPDPSSPIKHWYTTNDDGTATYVSTAEFPFAAS